MEDRPIEEIRDFAVIDIINKDFNNKEPHNLYLEARGCATDIDKRMRVFLEPNDTITFNPCKGGKPLSWEGTLRWDGRKLSPCERNVDKQQSE